MNQARNASLFVLAFVVLIGAGCADPAADAPKAVVGEADDMATDTGADDTMMEGEVYTLTDESSIGFVGSKVTGSHDGGFNSFDGTIHLVDGTAAGSRVEVTIDTTSLWSDNDNLTGHLKSADFFEVETYPTATFSSSEITENADGTHTVTGTLDLHGVTKKISFPATIVVTEGEVTANAEFAIKRFDFAIEYPGKAEDLIRDDVLVKLDLKAAPAA